MLLAVLQLESLALGLLGALPPTRQFLLACKILPFFRKGADFDYDPVFSFQWIPRKVWYFQEDVGESAPWGASFCEVTRLV